MPRSLWNGAIAFGLVNVPVELYPAEDRKTFKFSMLDKRDLAPVGYKRYNKKSGKDVEWGDIVKGYEYGKDEYVVLSDEDFRQANVKATQTIDIKAFVDAGAVPLEYFDTPYYLAPAKRGAKIYALLRETLLATNRIAIAQVVIRTTEHLAAVVVNGSALMLNTLRYPDELRDAKGLDIPAAGLKAAGVTAKEVELAKRLVNDMTEDWKPAQFRSSYHDDLMKRIKLKIKRGETKLITPPEAAEAEEGKSAQIIDLAELLQRSLGKAAPKKAAAAPAPGRGAKVVSVVGMSRAKVKPAAKPAPATKAVTRRKRA